MPFGPRLEGERAVLREVLPGDAQTRQLLGRHAEITRMFGAPQPTDAPMSADEANRWVTGLGGEGVLDWIVEADGAFLGGAGLHSFAFGTARYAIGLFDPARLGRGFGTETTRLVLTHAFGDLGLHEVVLKVLDFNERAIRCYKRCGFRELRREPSEVMDGTRRADDICMAVTAGELR